MQPGTNHVFRHFLYSLLLVLLFSPHPTPPQRGNEYLVVFSDLGFLLLGSSCNCFIENLTKILGTESQKLKLSDLTFTKE